MTKIHITLYLLSFFIAIPYLLAGQECTMYYPKKTHIKLDYFSYDSKNRQTNHHTYSLMAKKFMSGYSEFIVEDEITTRKNEMLYHQFKMSCKDGVFYLGAEKYIDPLKLRAYQNMKIDFELDSLEIPDFKKVNQMLPNASISASILRGSGPPLLRMEVYIYNRRFEAIESVNTPAGTFQCSKLTCDKIEIMGASRTKTQLVEWYAPKIGLIRSETYNKKGKLLGYTLLHCIGEEFLLP